MHRSVAYYIGSISNAGSSSSQSIACILADSIFEVRRAYLYIKLYVRKIGKGQKN